ncbi:MAG: S-layer homology domain-containing protein [Armatimonadetes bacterium]|nr:S-layer homology domain-containing protein [Armatimonadota bacterium]
MRTYVRKLATAVVIAALLPLAAVAVAEEAAEVKCEWCGNTVSSTSAAVVTDWETNTKHTFHSLACAVQAMNRDYPWSRVKSKSTTGKTISLTDAGGEWSADPEGSVLAVVRYENSESPQLHTFSSFSELSAYSRKRDRFARSVVKTVPLARINEEIALDEYAHVSGKVPSRPETTAAAAESGSPAQSPQSGSLPVDVPEDHWAAQSVKRVVEQGLMKGDPDGKFRGKDSITRYEMSVILDRLTSRRGEQQEARAPSTVTPDAAPDVPMFVPSDLDRRDQKTGANFFGQTGLMTVPSAGTMAAKDITAGYATMLDSNLAHVVMGFGSQSRWEGGIAVSGGDLPSAILLNGKYRLSKSGPHGSKMAVGLLDLTDEADMTPYGVLSKTYQLDLAGRSRSVEASVGLGLGDLLDGPFAGASTAVNDRTSLMLEWSDVADERSVNLGLAYRLLTGTDIKLGVVGGEVAASLAILRRF